MSSDPDSDEFLEPSHEPASPVALAEPPVSSAEPVAAVAAPAERRRVREARPPGGRTERKARGRKFALQNLSVWFDSWAQADALTTTGGPAAQRVEWMRILPFAALHLACAAVIWVGWSPVAVAVAAAMYLVRMFAITGFYHRYFSHRSFKTSRAMQFVMALIGASATQRGALWWASHHRRHHQRSDEPEDVHSPKQHGFWWSHIGWIGSRENFPTDKEAVRDLVRFPELRFLDRFDTLVPFVTGAALFGLGALLDALWPSLGTSAAQMLVWGYVISTVVLAHATFTINSLSHVFGSRRYETSDTSRNNLALALLTMGEGWHNNHHHYQSSARQGFYWWEVDLTYYGLKALSKLGLIWDLRPVPRAVRDGRTGRGARS